jgi:hypothetical protein
VHELSKTVCEWEASEAEWTSYVSFGILSVCEEERTDLSRMTKMRGNYRVLVFFEQRGRGMTGR